MKALPLSCLVFCLVFSAAAQAADASEKIFELEILQGAPPAKPRVLRVEKDDSVRIRVMSEVAGEIHLHGYRLEMKLAPGTPRELAFNVINQISFRVPGLAALRHFHRALQDEKASEFYPVSHGNAISLYFRDPEGNRIELFFDTPWYCAQPCRESVDFSKTDEEILAETERLARSLPGFQPRSGTGVGGVPGWCYLELQRSRDPCSGSLHDREDRATRAAASGAPRDATQKRLQENNARTSR